MSRNRASRASALGTNEAEPLRGGAHVLVCVKFKQVHTIQRRSFVRDA
jgi:hypothetical protein